MAEIHQGVADAFGNVVGHPRQAEDVQLQQTCGGGFTVGEFEHSISFDDGIGEERPGEGFRRGAGEIPLDQKGTGGGNRADARGPQRAALAQDAGRLAVDFGGGGANLDFPEHDVERFAVERFSAE